MQFWTLCVLCGAARQYHRAKKALSFNYRATLRVGMQFWTLCVLCGAARHCHRARKALSFNYRATLRVGMQFWTLCVLCVGLHVTQGVCDVRGIDVRLKAPFRPSASYFEGSK
ncbi:hypothetical protein GIW32_13290 [Pseudomonas syringae]|nr:hypothetical protein [Pseudomonas syringae]MCF5242214.1 hypothetical protein [Pseudomonas syringae]